MLYQVRALYTFIFSYAKGFGVRIQVRVNRIKTSNILPITHEFNYPSGV